MTAITRISGGVLGLVGIASFLGAMDPNANPVERAVNLAFGVAGLGAGGYLLFKPLKCE